MVSTFPPVQVPCASAQMHAVLVSSTILVLAHLLLLGWTQALSVGQILQSVNFSTHLILLRSQIFPLFHFYATSTTVLVVVFDAATPIRIMAWATFRSNDLHILLKVFDMSVEEVSGFLPRLSSTFPNLKPTFFHHNLRPSSQKEKTSSRRKASPERATARYVT